MKRETKNLIMSGVGVCTPKEMTEMESLAKAFLKTQEKTYKAYCFSYSRHKGFSKTINLDGQILRQRFDKVFQLEVENDAPRGGMQGIHIVIKRNKFNVEAMEFLLNTIKLYREEK